MLLTLLAWDCVEELLAIPRPFCSGKAALVLPMLVEGSIGERLAVPACVRAVTCPAVWLCTLIVALADWIVAFALRVVLVPVLAEIVCTVPPTAGTVEFTRAAIWVLLLV